MCPDCDLCPVFLLARIYVASTGILSEATDYTGRFEILGTITFVYETTKRGALADAGGAKMCSLESRLSRAPL